jgi:plastocyanin
LIKGLQVRLRWHSGAVALLLLASDLGAAELTVRITSARGAPVADAVVTVTPQTGTAAPITRPAAETRIIDQKNETFIPYVEIFHPGDSIVFHNSDHTRHHVYSFAPARQFEFVLTSGASSAPLQLEHAGVVAVGCNIHDQMITYLYISDAPWIVRSGADGRVVFDTLPQGDFNVRVWHPQLRPGQPDPVQALHVDASSDAKELTFSLSLLPDPRTPADHERAGY